MGPDNFTRQPNGQPRPRPINDMAPRQPQRPMQDFGPRPTRPMQPMQPLNPAANRPMQPMQHLQPRPLNNFPQQTTSAQPSQSQYAPQPSQVIKTDFSPQNSPHQKAKKKFQIPKPSKLSFVLGTTAVIIVAGLVITSIWQNKPDSSAKAENKAPSVKPLEQPTFTTYFPSPMPDGLSVAKGSIAYYKDSFTYILEQGGQKSFFVYEQPASSDPDFNNLKGKLAAPKSIALTTGQGLEGGLDNGTVTAIKTDKNTLIIINCTKIVCSTAPRDILSSMQVNSDLSSLKNDNS